MQVPRPFMWPVGALPNSDMSHGPRLLKEDLYGSFCKLGVLFAGVLVRRALKGFVSGPLVFGNFHTRVMPGLPTQGYAAMRVHIKSCGHGFYGFGLPLANTSGNQLVGTLGPRNSE